jgi:uncharacterized protein
MIRTTALVAPVLALAACAPAPPDPRGLERGETLLQASASGEAEAKPDEARFTIGVTSIGADANAAMRANATKMAAVVAALKGAGAAEADLQTSQIAAARQDWGPNRGKYEVSNTVAVRLRDVDKAGAAIGAASQAGANLMAGPDLRVADPETAGKAAYAKAYKAARTRADAYAEAAGLKVVRILAIRDGGSPVTPQSYDMAMEAPRRVAAPAPPVLAGTNAMQATVAVDFALAPK